jgi:hypothetical protein
MNVLLTRCGLLFDAISDLRLSAGKLDKYSWEDAYLELAGLVVGAVADGDEFLVLAGVWEPGRVSAFGTCRKEGRSGVAHHASRSRLALAALFRAPVEVLAAGLWS